MVNRALTVSPSPARQPSPLPSAVMTVIAGENLQPRFLTPPPNLRRPSAMKESLQNPRLMLQMPLSDSDIQEHLNQWINQAQSVEQKQARTLITRQLLSLGATFTRGRIYVDYFSLDSLDKEMTGVELPDNLTVQKSLILDNTDLCCLPKALEVRQDCNLSGSARLQSFPNDFVVKGNLDALNCTALQSIPDDFTVGGSFNLSDCMALTHLPKRLLVGSSLNLSGCKGLRHLSNSLIVISDLILNDCAGLNLLSEPDPSWEERNKTPTIGGNIFINSCRALHYLPDWLFTLGARNYGDRRYIYVSDSVIPKLLLSLFAKRIELRGKPIQMVIADLTHPCRLDVIDRLNIDRFNAAAKLNWSGLPEWRGVLPETKSCSWSLKNLKEIQESNRALLISQRFLSEKCDERKVFPHLFDGELKDYLLVWWVEHGTNPVTREPFALTDLYWYAPGESVSSSLQVD